MTVAAVIVPTPGVDLLAPTPGRPLVRRLVDVAWSGGALPIVVVASDPRGDVAAALGGTSALIVDPASSPGGAPEPSPIVAGVEAALGAVSGTSAVLIWPTGQAWVDPETLTSLIEAHGRGPTTAIRPAFEGQAGWPVLVPVAHVGKLRAAGSGTSADPGRSVADSVDRLLAQGVPLRAIDLGDPGAVMDASVSLEDHPAYIGPLEPAGGPPPEWGASIDGESGGGLAEP